MQSGLTPPGKQAECLLGVSGLPLPAREAHTCSKPTFDTSHIHCGNSAVATRHNAFVLLPLNAEQRGLTYLRAKHVEPFDFSIGRIMKLVKAIAWMVLGVFLIGFGVFVKIALRPLMQEGFWPALAGLLICFGVLLIATGVAAQIARTPKRNRLTKVSDEKVARLLAAYPGPVTLKASRTGWVMMAFSVVSIAFCIFEGALAFLGQQTGNNATADLAASAFEMSLWGLAAGAISARALLHGALQLDKNGFQATFFSRKQYLWADVCDFHSTTSGIRFSVVEPDSPHPVGEMNGRFSSSSVALADNYGLEAEELADLMESWQSAALDGQGDKLPLTPAISKSNFQDLH
jgi:hypothetical protein